MLHHQKAEDGNGKLDRGLARHFAVPDGDFDRWHYLTQVNQARAVATGIEHWRSHWPVCAGTIVWQLNDCWPVTSWAAIDGDGREKPLYHELRRLYADRLLTVQLRDGRLVSAAVNQAARGVGGHGDAAPAVRGRRRCSATATLELARRRPDGRRACRCRRELEPGRRRRSSWWPTRDGLRAVHVRRRRTGTFAYPGARRDVAVAPGPATVAPGRSPSRPAPCVRDLLLQADRLDPAARADRGLVTLLPGERGDHRGARLGDSGRRDAARRRAVLPWSPLDDSAQPGPAASPSRTSPRAPGCPRARCRSPSTTSRGCRRRPGTGSSRRRGSWAGRRTDGAVAVRRRGWTWWVWRSAGRPGCSASSRSTWSSSPGVESVLTERSCSLLLRLVRNVEEEVGLQESWWRGRQIGGSILVDFRADDPRVAAVERLGHAGGRGRASRR